jgi:hypothetical protein
LAIVEVGCGTVVPTIRNMCEKIYYQNKNSILIRVNPEEDPSGDHFDQERFFYLRENALPALKTLAKLAFNVE